MKSKSKIGLRQIETLDIGNLTTHTKYHTPHKDSDIQSVLTKPKTYNRLNLIDLRNGPVPLEPFHTVPNTFRNCRKNHNFTSGLKGMVVWIKKYMKFRYLIKVTY